MNHPGAATMQPPDFQKLPENWRQQWWFFDPRCGCRKTDAAFKWEVVRRSDVYWQMWRANSPLTAQHESTGNAQSRGGWLREARRTPLGYLALWEKCSPFSRWIDLTQNQQRAVESRADLLPELNAPEGIGQAMAVGLAEIADNPDTGNRRVIPLWAAGGALTIGGFTESTAFKQIPPGKWIVITFDARVPHDRLAKQFDETLAGPKADPATQLATHFGLALAEKCKTGCFPHACHQIETLLAELPRVKAARRSPKVKTERRQAIWDELILLDADALHPPAWREAQEAVTDAHLLRASRQQVRVIPARYDPDAACLIPAACNVAEVRKLFLNAVHRDHRKTWLPGCESHWRKQVGAKGIGPLPALKLVKSSQSKFRWLALAAHNSEPLRMGELATNFLRAQWLAITGSGRIEELPWGKRQRLAYNELHSLRGDMAAILKRVDESPQFSRAKPVL